MKKGVIGVIMAVVMVIAPPIGFSRTASATNKYRCNSCGQKLFNILKRSMAVTLAVSLTVEITPLNIKNNVDNVKNAKAADTSLTFEVGEGTATKPQFNAANFPTLDTDANVEYYFGKNGNAFYGVPRSTACNVGFTSSTSWELVDTDCDLGNGKLSSNWGIYNITSILNGQPILDYCKGLVDSSFSTIDQLAMKSENISTDYYCYKWSGDASGSVSGAKLWPLSVPQLVVNGVEPNTSYNGNTPSTNLEKKLYNNSSGGIWTRSGSDGLNGAWLLLNNYICGGFGVGDINYVAPAFNLDLTKVLKIKDYKNGKKFLINVGDEKGNFNTPIAGKKLKDVCIGKTYSFDYNDAELINLNRGKNYISAIIYDKNGKVVYYGELDKISSISGTLHITIPNDLIVGKDYTLALFEEEVFSDGKTDYASEPVYATFTAKDKSTLSYDVTTNGGASTAPDSIADIEPDTVFDKASGVFDKTATKTDWTFVGWNTKSNAHEKLTSLKMDSDKKLYAIFKKDVAASFVDG